MGTSKSVGQFAAKIHETAKALQSAQLDAVRKAALVAKRQVEQERSKVARSGRLRNVGKRGAALGVGYTIDAGQSPSATIMARGPWPIIESDTPRHTIGARAKRGGVLRLPDGGFRATVVHPGTKGKHPFRKGIDASVEPVTDVMRSASLDAVRRVFS